MTCPVRDEVFLLLHEVGDEDRECRMVAGCDWEGSRIREITGGWERTPFGPPDMPGRKVRKETSLFGGIAS